MEQSWETIYPNIPCGIFSFGEDGFIVSANRFFCGLLGYAEDGLVGRHMTDLFGAAGKIFYGTHLYPMIKLQNRADEVFLKFRSVEGRDVSVLMNAVVCIKDGQKIFACACIPVANRNAYESELLAAKKKAEQELEEGLSASGQKEREKKQNELVDRQTVMLKQQHDELLRLGVIVSHDLQEPLRKLELYSNSLQKKQDGGKSNDKALAIIQKSAIQIRHRLLQLQTFLDIKRDEYLGEDVWLSSVVSKQLEIVRTLFPDIKLEYTIEALPNVKGNRRQLSILLFELIKNAFAHGTIDKKLSLKIQGVVLKENANHSSAGRYNYQNHVRIMISDAGKGFGKDYSHHIFDILNKMGDPEAHLGIGLSICKRIIEVHGGKIWADGNPGKGALFYFTLPINASVNEPFQTLFSQVKTSDGLG